MPTQDTSEILLIPRAVSGSQRAFAALFQRHLQSVYNYALSLCNDPDLAIIQETFIRAMPRFRISVHPGNSAPGFCA